MQDHFAGPRRTLIDAATLSSDGTVSIAGAYPDRRGLRVAYLLSEAGSDRQILRIRDVETGRDLRETLTGCKHTSVAWFPNGRGFFYTRYPSERDPADWDRRSHIVCRHIVGARIRRTIRVVFRLRRLAGRLSVALDVVRRAALRIAVNTGTNEKAGYYVAPLDDCRESHRAHRSERGGVLADRQCRRDPLRHHQSRRAEMAAGADRPVGSQARALAYGHPRERGHARPCGRVRQPAGGEAPRQPQQPHFDLRSRRPQALDARFRRPGARVVRRVTIVPTIIC